MESEKGFLAKSIFRLLRKKRTSERAKMEKGASGAVVGGPMSLNLKLHLPKRIALLIEGLVNIVS